VLIQGERGYVIMSAAGPEAVLTVLAKSNAKLGLIFLDIKRAAQALSKMI
jgi:predicted regulator of Ras-like GTPase activity (Roadblock/LC7/MglB family)